MVTPDDPFAGLPLPERIAAKASSLAADAEPVQGAHVTTGSLPPDSDPDRHRTAWLLPDGTCALPEPDTIAWVTVSDTPDGPARRVPVSEAGAYPPQSGLPTDAVYVDPAREAGRLRALLAEADQRAALLRRQVEDVTTERDDAAAEAEHKRRLWEEQKQRTVRACIEHDRLSVEVEQIRTVLAEILDKRRWSLVHPRLVVTMEATITELADWRARAAGQPPRVPAPAPDGD